MKVYVFLVKREKHDRIAWPCVYQSKELAYAAYGRISPVVEVDLPEKRRRIKWDWQWRGWYEHFVGEENTVLFRHGTQGVLMIKRNSPNESK